MVDISFGNFYAGQTNYIPVLNSNFEISRNFLEYHDQEIAIVKGALSPGSDLDYRSLAFNLLENGSFDYWQRGTNTRPDCWKIENNDPNATVGRNSIVKKLNTYTILATNKIQLTQKLDQNLVTSLDITTALTFGCWVKTSYTDKARIGIYNGLVTNWSSYHSGTDEWEFLTVTLLATNEASEIKFILDSGATSLNWFNSAVVIKGNPASEPVFIYNDKTLEELRVLSNIEVNKSSVRGVGLLRNGDRELLVRVNFVAPKKTIPLISFPGDIDTGYDILYNNASRYGFDLHVIELNGASGTNGFEYLDIDWMATIAE